MAFGYFIIPPQTLVNAIIYGLVVFFLTFTLAFVLQLRS